MLEMIVSAFLVFLM